MKFKKVKPVRYQIIDGVAVEVDPKKIKKSKPNSAWKDACPICDRPLEECCGNCIFDDWPYRGF